MEVLVELVRVVEESKAVERALEGLERAGVVQLEAAKAAVTRAGAGMEVAGMGVVVMEAEMAVVGTAAMMEAVARAEVATEVEGMAAVA